MKYKLKPVIKSILYVSMVHCLSIINVILYYAKDLKAILIQMAIFIVFAPMYFWIKGDTKTPWLYTLTTVVWHLMLVILVPRIFILVDYNYDLEFGVVFWEQILLMFFFACVILLDILRMLWKKFISKKKTTSVESDKS